MWRPTPHLPKSSSQLSSLPFLPPSQYLAARELRRQGWRYSNRTSAFHKRVGEPDDAAPDGSSERGTFQAFEYDTGWIVRSKRDFTLTRAECPAPDE